MVNRKGKPRPPARIGQAGKPRQESWAKSTEDHPQDAVGKTDCPSSTHLADVVQERGDEQIAVLLTTRAQRLANTTQVGLIE
ncbi:MAG: hypothetical protein QOG89_563 [Thermomicrobiales bacterium]|nr:hypothetical protein [Thermomicrobiales bacterium]